MNMVFGFLITAVFACSHGPVVQDFPDTASAKDEVSKLKVSLAEAKENQVDILALTYFKEATASFRDAKSSLDSEDDAKDTLRDVAEGRANLGQAEKFAKLSRANIGDVITARNQAVEAGAPKLQKSDFKKADENLLEVTADIEKNELGEAIEKRSALQLAYLDLELKSIKQTRLSAAQATIAKAEKEGAEEFAPRSLATAEKSVQDTDAYITANRHSTAEIDARSTATIAAADHLLKITRDAKSGDKTSPEETALQMEREQVKTSNSEEEVAEGETANKALEAKNAKLKSEQVFNERFEAARRQFTASEAEVYKQGDSLVIRLRGLEFPVAKADLQGSSFPLLAKVQRVIADFGKGSIIVEGHTDSNGGKVLNEKLSAERAEAVKQYLLSISKEQPMNIEAVGYGYQKPLATNKTPGGRAQNRRVDVLIQAARI